MTKKKIKVLKKTKIKEIKKKVEIKEIKKNSSSLKTNLENLEESLNDESFSQVLQQNNSPVLEQIAVSGGSNLENIIPIKKEGSDKSFDSGVDYTQLGSLKDEENKYQEASSSYDGIANLDKDERDRIRNLELMRPDGKRKPGENSFEFEDGSKKYINQGDYKP